MDDEIVWRVADPTILLIKSTSVEGKNSTAQIEWIGGTETTKFFAGLKSILMNIQKVLLCCLKAIQTVIKMAQNENKRIKRQKFESPESRKNF